MHAALTLLCCLAVGIGDILGIVFNYDEIRGVALAGVPCQALLAGHIYRFNLVCAISGMIVYFHTSNTLPVDYLINVVKVISLDGPQDFVVLVECHHVSVATCYAHLGDSFRIVTNYSAVAVEVVNINFCLHNLFIFVLLFVYECKGIDKYLYYQIKYILISIFNIYLIDIYLYYINNVYLCKKEKKMNTYIKEYLNKSGITQKELARRLGVQQATVSATISRPSFPTLERIAAALDVEPWKLLAPPAVVEELKQARVQRSGVGGGGLVGVVRVGCEIYTADTVQQLRAIVERLEQGDNNK